MASSSQRALKRLIFPGGDPLQTLPEELLHRIFLLVIRERLSSGVAVLPRVSKAWNAICTKPSKLWEAVKLDLKSKSTARSGPLYKTNCLAWLARRLQAVRHLSLTLQKSALVWPALNHLLLASQLQVLFVSSPTEGNAEILDQDCLEAIARISSLQVLKLTNIAGGLESIDKFRHLSDLRELYVGFEGPLQKETFSFPPSLCRLAGLRKLLIHCNRYYERLEVVLPPQMSNLSKLEVLNLSRHFPITRPQGSTAPLLPLLPALKTLVMAFEADDSDAKYPESLKSLRLMLSGGFNKSIAACTGLQQLKLGDCDLTTDSAHEVLELMAKNLRQLTCLELGSSAWYDEHLLKLTTIRVLHLDCWPEVEDQFELESYVFWSRLEVVSLEHITDCVILHHATSLRILELRWSDYVHAQAEAVFRLPKLQVLFQPVLDDFTLENAHDLMKLMNRRRDVTVHVDYGDKQPASLPPELLPWPELDISPCFMV